MGCGCNKKKSNVKVTKNKKATDIKPVTQAVKTRKAKYRHVKPSGASITRAFSTLQKRAKKRKKSRTI